MRWVGDVASEVGAVFALDGVDTDVARQRNIDEATIPYGAERQRRRAPFFRRDVVAVEGSPAVAPVREVGPRNRVQGAPEDCAAGKTRQFRPFVLSHVVVLEPGFT